MIRNAMPTAAVPWYRQPWPWLLMSGPLLVIIAGVLTLYIAVRSNDGLVDDDYYKQGLAVNQLTARTRQAERLGLGAEVTLADNGHTLRVVFARGQLPRPPAMLRLNVVHPTRSAQDQHLMLTPERMLTGGELPEELAYSTALPASLSGSGRWNLLLEDDSLAWRMTGEWAVGDTPARLGILTKSMAGRP